MPVWKQGADAFAKSLGVEAVTLVSEGNSEKGIADIRAMIAKTGGNMVLNVDPNDTPDARPIVEACAKAGIYVTTQWNKPADLHPWDFNPYYIAQIEFNGVTSGEDIANTLFKAIGGKGGIVALGGMISTTAAIERRKGLDRALAAHPEVKLLDFQTADWKSQPAFDTTSGLLTRFGDKIAGIWAANDDMGVGALEALRAEGLAGKVPVVGIDGIKAAVDAVQYRRVRLHDHIGPVLAGRHRPVAGLPRQDRQLRSGQGTASASRVLCDDNQDHQGQRRRLYQDPRRYASGDRLERSVGARGRTDRLYLTKSRAAVPGEAVAGEAGGRETAARLPLRPGARRWLGLAGPFAVLMAMSSLIGLANPAFFEFRNLVRVANSAAIPLILASGATFIIVMGSIDLSVEGGVAVGTMIVALLATNDANANDYGWFAPLLAVLVVTGLGLSTA